MFQALHERLHKDEKGFTLIELMVVVLIIAILIAIAIPTFLGARSRAQDRAAQTDLRNSLVAGEVWYTDHESYDLTADGGAGVAELTALEPELSFSDVAADLETVGTVLVIDAADNMLFLRLSASGTYFGLAKNLDDLVGEVGTTYCSSTTTGATDINTVATCQGDSW